MSWSELSNRKEAQEGWLEVKYSAVTSHAACSERKFLFASDDSYISSLRYI